MNYDKLINDWFDKLQNESDTKMNLHDMCEIGSYKEGYNRGFSDGLMKAYAIFNNMEKRENK